VTAPKASDFYDIRRGWIRDAVAGVAFLVGFIGAGPVGWAMMQDDVNAGDMARGLLRFLGVVVVAGVAAGVAGLGAGTAIGWLWQRIHAAARRSVPPDSVEARTAAPGGRTARPDRAWAIRYDGATITDDAFAALLRACAIDPDGSATALARTINVGAWYETTLIGIVRVLSDGRRHAAVAEVLVHPDYRRLGVGRELMRRAAGQGGVAAGLTIAAPRDAVRFFEKIGALRGPTGLVLRPPPTDRGA
jgi:GNAT superfamily N-acetyltransferase